MPTYRLTYFAALLFCIFQCVLNNSATLGDSSGDSSAKFFRAINLNGPALTIDDQSWEAGDTPDVVSKSNAFDSQEIQLVPATDPQRAKMIRSSRWGSDFKVELRNVPPGVYQVFLYCWEDNNPEKFAINLNKRTVVLEHNSGSAGQWKRLGPWRTVVRDGTIQVGAFGGAANFSGLEIWSGDGNVPDPYDRQFATELTDTQLHFFESKIRPLLVDKCYSCHSIEAGEPDGGLLLDSRVGIMKGGDTDRAILPGNAEESLLIKAVRRKLPDLAMPPDEELSTEQIADLEQWVAMRAPDPRTEDTIAELKARSEIDWEQARDFWSLRPLSTSPPPAVADGDWATADLDKFILAKIEAAGLAPAPDAEKLQLIRRATYDLIGLPPTPEEVAAFLADDSADAYEKLIDRLLSSKHYGERWGRHWLDIVRYSDTAGDNSDFPIPQMHLYRNWVIDAFNRDLPYDQFVREQLAGDLLESDSETQRRERLIATGYISNTRRFGSRVDDYPQHLTIEDTLDNLGKTFLATTINCARCHNHKFDPVTAEDYYALYGIFHSTRYPWPGIELDQKQRNFVVLAAENELNAYEEQHKAETERLKSAVKKAEKDLNDASTAVVKEELEKSLKAAKELLNQHQSKPLPFPTIYAVAESQSIEDVAVQLKGDPGKPGDIVPRRFLSVLGGEELPVADTSSGRLQLAEWIVDRKNPLTARVIANRVWQYHFGSGIVPTPNDFGRQGKPATHPELLDWLASELMENGWSLKHLHRVIMLSRTYRLSSTKHPKLAEIDPANTLLSSYPRHRLDAESIRDTLLLLGGNLDLTPGEAHPFPPQSEWKFTQHNPFKAVYESNRRSVYLMTQRIQRHPYLAIFDGPDPATSTALRGISTTPLQALYLLNDKFVHEQATGLAKQLLETQATDEARIKKAWELIFCRPVNSEEQTETQNYLANFRHVYEGQNVASDQLDLLAWEAVIRSLFRTNEFVYID